MKTLMRTISCGASSSIDDTELLLKARAVAIVLEGGVVCNAVAVSSRDIAIPNKCWNNSETVLSELEAQMQHPGKDIDPDIYKLCSVSKGLGCDESIDIVKVSIMIISHLEMANFAFIVNFDKLNTFNYMCSP